MLGLLGFLLGLLGGALMLVAALTVRGNVTLTFEFILERLVQIGLGALVLLGSLLIFRRRYSTGGIIDLVLGIAGLLIGSSQIGAILALLGGVLGLVASEARA